MTKLSRIFVPLALCLVLSGAAGAEESAAQWFAKCKAQTERLFGDELKRVKLTDIRISDVMLRVHVADEAFIVACKMDTKRDELIAYRFKDLDWQAVRLTAGKF